MKKKFHTKKRKNKLKYIFYLIVIVLLLYCAKLFLNISFFNNSSNFVNYLLDSAFSENLNLDKISSKISSFLSFINIKNPITILEESFGYSDNEMYNDIYNIDELEQMTSHISDSNPQEITNPLIYIYNSHQLENYSDIISEATNLEPNVMQASFLLRDALLEQNIESIVEEADITSYMKENNMLHNDSYNASRKFIKDAIAKYPNIKLFIDIHRDAINHDNATTTINDKPCSKILFVVGLEYDNYQTNLDYANKLNKVIKEKYPNLTRGVLTKKGSGVNGIYNQDLKTNMILLEIGGNESNIEEVKNTIDLISTIIKENL